MAMGARIGRSLTGRVGAIGGGAVGLGLSLGIEGIASLDWSGDGLIDGEDWDEFGLKDNPDICYAKRTRKEKNKAKPPSNRNGRNKNDQHEDDQVHTKDTRGKGGYYKGGRR